MGFFSKKQSNQDSDSALISQLKSEQAKTSIIINAIIDGVLLTDEKGVIHIFNPAAARITGWLAEEAIGLDYRSVISLVNDKGEALEPASHPINQVFKNGQPQSGLRASIITKTGNRVLLDFSVSPLLSGGKIGGAVAVFRDVSQQHSDEQKRADFISTASHEMRTPVAAIEGYLALALNENVSKIDTKARNFLEKAHSSTQHLGQLFQDLLTSAKAEDGRLTNHPQVVEMGELTERLADGLKFSASKKGLKMEYIVGSQPTVVDATQNQAGMKTIRPLYYVYADPDRLQEVVTNLFDNAVKYTESGAVRLGITGNDTNVQVHVADTGPGIPSEDIPHLFQKFYRVDSSATRTVGGTGLGLFICKKIVELYNGKLWVESTVGKGSTFYINLPRLTNEKAESLKSEAVVSPLGD